MTAFGREEARTEAERLNIEHFLVKPVTRSTLVDTLVTLFAQPDAHPALDLRREEAHHLVVVLRQQQRPPDAREVGGVVRPVEQAVHHPAALLDKPARREFDVRIDYLGFTVPNVFVAGYGLDGLDDTMANIPRAPSRRRTTRRLASNLPC